MIYAMIHNLYLYTDIIFLFDIYIVYVYVLLLIGPNMFWR